MDICLQVIIDAPAHVIADPVKDARRYSQGDIVEVYDAAILGTYDAVAGVYIPKEPIGSARLGFVFITGVPDAPLEKVRGDMIRPELSAVTTGPDVLKRRIMAGNVAAMTAATISQLQADRHMTFPWTLARDYLINKTTSQALTDADITGA